MIDAETLLKLQIAILWRDEIQVRRHTPGAIHQIRELVSAQCPTQKPPSHHRPHVGVLILKVVCNGRGGCEVEDEDVDDHWEEFDRWDGRYIWTQNE